LNESIAKAVKQAKGYLHRTKVSNDGISHRAHVCVMCDCFILGIDSIRYLRPAVIKLHKHHIGVDSYEVYFKTKLKKELVEQYHVSNLPGLLLSPRSKLTEKGYTTCTCCCKNMQRADVARTNPPKFAIANGFVIGSITSVIYFVNNEGNTERRHINVEEEVNDVLHAYLVPIRPYGCSFAYSGGSHKLVIGHYQLFEVDQSHVGGVMKKFDPADVGK